ncbi:hypothetical protein ACQ33O_06945 [Ferruginibacter sp. SUN002]|uniref:hypothetical protein n=1 Tax=Ferruginibacter sp. SUN002 TaxID=2937789 RepID=UPI003D35BE6C
MKTLPLIFLVFLFACTANKTKQKEQDSVSYSSIITALQKSSTPSSFFNNDYWKQYESTGNPDTAIALFTYRIIKQVDTSFDNTESHIRLYNEDKKVKNLILTIFKSDTSISSILNKIDALNSSFRAFAEKEVNSEMKKHGAFTGPLGEFIESLKSN